MSDFDFDELIKAKGKYKIKSGDPQKMATVYRITRYIVFGALVIWSLVSFLKDTDSSAAIGIQFFALLVIASFLLIISFSFIRLFELRRDKPFTAELNQVIAEYNKSKDAGHYLKQLLSMEAVAKDAFIIAQWRLHIADALKTMRRYKDALDIIDDLDNMVSGELKEQLARTRAQIHALATTEPHKQEMDN